MIGDFPGYLRVLGEIFGGFGEIFGLEICLECCLDVALMLP